MKLTLSARHGERSLKRLKQLAAELVDALKEGPRAGGVIDDPLEPSDIMTVFVAAIAITWRMASLPGTTDEDFATMICEQLLAALDDLPSPHRPRIILPRGGIQ